MDVLETPTDRLEDLPGYPFDVETVEVEDLTMTYIDEGDPDAEETFLCLHGEPTWSYLYRKMVPVLAERGRVVCPDLVGFGGSDKPVDDEAHTYDLHARTVTGFIETLDLAGVTLVGQDWGGILGLHAAARMPDRFSRIVAANTFLPDGTHEMPEAWLRFHAFVERTPDVPVGFLVQRGCTSELPEEVVAAYDAPFPDERYKAGARRLPKMVPQDPEHPAADEIAETTELLGAWEKPAICIFAEEDPIMKPAATAMRKILPPAQEEPLVWLEDAGHFLQEDVGEELAEQIVAFVDRT